MSNVYVTDHVHESIYKDQQQVATYVGSVRLLTII